MFKSKKLQGLLGGVVLASLTLASAGPALAWWENGYAYRTKINVDAQAASVGGEVSRAPVLVRLHQGNFNFADVKADGSDLRFVAGDDRTPLKFHIEKWSPQEQQALVWVDVSEIKPGVASAIYAYYGNEKAQAAQDVAGTLGQYKLVWHFDQAGVPKDASGKGADAASGGEGRNAGGLIGQSLTLDGSAPVVFPASAFDGNAVSVSLWLKATSDGQVFSLPGAATVSLSGGGDIDVRVSGALNPWSDPNEAAQKTALNGSVINLRGMINLDAASIGSIRTFYRQGLNTNPVDPRAADPFEQAYARSQSGIVLVPGDSAVYLQTAGDMVVAGAGDATRSLLRNTSSFTLNGTDYAGDGNSWFSLWTDRTALNLTSLGGHMTPTKEAEQYLYGGAAHDSDIGDFLPSILRITALGGNVYFGASAGYTGEVSHTGDILAPSAKSELSVVSAGSIYGGDRQTSFVNASRHSLTLSATGTPLPTPFNPAFVGLSGGPNSDLVSNLSVEGEAGDFFGAGSGQKFFWFEDNFSLMAFGPNTAATAAPRPADAQPVRIYAAGGDIVGLSSGMRGTYRDGSSTKPGYKGGAPLWMKASGDIVHSGLTTDTILSNNLPNLIVHSHATDVSIISAGRDILFSTFEIAGPGTLELTAGRDIRMEEMAHVTSLGSIVAGDTRPGASIVMAAGMTDANWKAVRDLYLDPTRLLTPNPDGQMPPLEGSGKVAKVYNTELGEWLKARYGFSGTGEEALAYFDALAPEHQRIFLRQIYYAEAREGGREYNDAEGPRFASYLRGRQMIATLFPDKDANGRDIVRTGDIIMNSAAFTGEDGLHQPVSGIHDGYVNTLFGGDIELMAPGGQVVIGVQGTVPGATAGLTTQGAGDIRIFSEKSLLLGLSRIMTTFGGDIFAWSETGDINAGRGAKSTVVYTPPRLVYDNYGNPRLAPQVPSSGAGIATLAPIPEVPAGDVDLIAPLGVIDAGEAGIRVSGNVNLAALQIINAANIQVKGEAVGVPQAVVVNTGALAQASGATSAVVNQATELAERARPKPVIDTPVIFNIRLLGFGDE